MLNSGLNTVPLAAGENTVAVTGGPPGQVSLAHLQLLHGVPHPRHELVLRVSETQNVNLSPPVKILKRQNYGIRTLLRPLVIALITEMPSLY